MQKKTHNKLSSDLRTPCFVLQEGFTLLETLAAIFVITVAIVGIFGLITRLTATAAYLSSRLTAAYLAQEGVEIVRNIRDSNWLAFRSWDTGLTGCFNGCEADHNDPFLAPWVGNGRHLLLNGQGFYSYDAGSETKFRRKITVRPNGDVLDVLVKVMWDARQFTVRERLYRWR